MMNKKQPFGTTERTTERRGTLTPLEEKVVRMRRGLRAPASLALEHASGGDPELRAKLDAIEKRALAAAGPRSTSVKRKIISTLRHKKP